MFVGICIFKSLVIVVFWKSNFHLNAMLRHQGTTKLRSLNIFVNIFQSNFDKESSKIVLKLFLKKPSTNYETPSSYESTDTKIFKKIERELAFWAVQSIWVQ